MRLFGSFRKGELHGCGLKADPDGKLRLGQFVGGKQFGQSCMFDLGLGENKRSAAESQFYVGSFINGDYEGLGILRDRSGNIYVGHFSMGVQNGFGMYVRANGEVLFLGYFSDNQNKTKIQDRKSVV